jgi:alpha-L-rhamnosidase
LGARVEQMTRTPSPVRLRVEHLDTPLGVSVERPRLSWWLPVGTTGQRAYQLVVGAWDSGRVDSDQSLLVPYDGPPLPASQIVPWRVRVWTDAGQSDWAGSTFGTALRRRDWQATWIAPVEDEAAPAGARPVHLLRRRWPLAGPVATAQLHITARGLYEAHLNGSRVGDVELTPGSTDYRTHQQVQAYDVTELLESENELVVTLSDGWFRGQNSHSRLSSCWGDEVAVLAQLVAHHSDGTVTVLGTDAEWECGAGPLLTADLIAGQTVDLRLHPHGWRPVQVVDLPFDPLTGTTAPPVRRIEEVRPVVVTQLPDGTQVADLGQNINGWVRVSAPEGALRIEHGEALDADGRVTRQHLLGPAGHDPGQVDVVTGPGVLELRHSTKGFRYVGTSTRAEVTGIVVHTDLERTGRFRCSDDDLNRLHDAAVWSFRGNACDVPTDCPTRERAGWTGDWQLYVPTAAFLYDVAGFTTKWLRDLAAQQWPDGRVPNWVPDPGWSEEHRATNEPYTGSAGWGDAAVQVPYQQWWCYGDVRTLEEQWDSMVRWMAFATESARTERHASKAGTPAQPHEQHIWDGGFHWGDWLEPDADMDSIVAVLRRQIDQGAVATAYLCRSARQMAQVATVLGRSPDDYARLAACVRDAWVREYVADDGSLTPAVQATYVLALAFDLVPHELRQATADRLAQMVRDNGNHLATGFLTTPLLLPVLADNGHLDVAYDLLLQRTEPSWLGMLDRGATTIWEFWNGLDEQGRATGSLNHYSKGAVISFLHQYVAGIRQVEGVPAYRRFVIAPRPGGGLTSAEATLASPYGTIRSAWSVGDAGLRVEVNVPPGTTARLELPGRPAEELAPGAHTR